MSRTSRYVCQGCGMESPRWLGKCTECGEWNSFVEEPYGPARKKGAPAAPRPRPLDEISLADDDRLSTGSAELDRVLGGGIVRGSVVLLGGDPGIGKTTLLLESLGRMSGRLERPVLYCTGEESPRQIKLRAERLGLHSARLLVLAQNTVEGILEETAKSDPAIVVVDSIQTMTSARIESAAGSVSQVRQVAGELVPMAKAREVPVFIVGHVTKEGALAGPKILEHVVDTVLYFEGEQTRDYRILRAVKNRFGSTNEIGIFEMTEGGLREVTNPSRLFLRHGEGDLPGSVVTASLEGTRPFLVEIQSLAAPTSFSVPRRGCSGADSNRFAMLLAVLEKKVGLGLQDHDIYLNFAGGMKIGEPAADAGILAAVCSGFRNRAVSHSTVVFGEVGLTGEVRAVPGAERRIREAAKLGFARCLLPAANLSRIEEKGLNIELLGISHVEGLLELVFS